MAQNPPPGVVNPTLQSVTPNQAAVKGGQSITLVGTGFQAGTTVKIGGVPATNVNVQSRTLISATVPAYTGNIGPVEVLIENPDGGKVSRTDLFSFIRVQVAFADTLTRASGGSPVAIAAEDINGDGGRDLLIANYDDSTVTVLISNQNYMSVAGPYPTAAFPTTIAVAEVNSDAYKDIITSCANGTGDDIAVLRGVGNGAFMMPDKFTVGMNATGVVAKDFDGDGKTDLAVSVRTQNKIFVMTNNIATPGNVSSFATPYVSYAIGNGPVALISADVTGDGRDDLIAANSTDNQIAVLTGMTGGTFQTPAIATSVGTGPFGMAAADLTGDGKVDLVVTNNGSNTLSLLKGQGDGTFVAAAPIQTTTSPTAVAIADLDGDGKADLVIANSGQNQIWVLLGNGDGTFDPPQYFLTGQQPWALTIADLDGDGKLDIATANRGSGDVSILYNRTVR